MEIYKSLLKAQKEMMAAGKDAKNPFFKSTYATLNSVWETAKTPLHSNNLVLLQPIDIVDGQQVVKTMLIHENGETITSNCPIVCSKPNDPQALGSAITYARRYSLASILGMMTDEDDDGNKGSGRGDKQPQQKPQAKPIQKEEKKPSIDVGAFEKKVRDLLGLCDSIDKLNGFLKDEEVSSLMSAIKDEDEKVYDKIRSDIKLKLTQLKGKSDVENKKTDS